MTTIEVACAVATLPCPCSQGSPCILCTPILGDKSFAHHVECERCIEGRVSEMPEVS